MDRWGYEDEYDRAKAKSERRRIRMAKYREKKDDFLSVSGVQKESSSEAGSSATRKKLQENGKVRGMQQAQERDQI